MMSNSPNHHQTAKSSNHHRHVTRSRSAFYNPNNSLSIVRIIFVLTLATFLYVNVFKVNSRYHTQIYIQDVVVSFEVVESMENVLELPSNQQPLPPIYWINLDSSTERRQYMRAQFKRLGITETHRISATNVNQTKDLWKQGDKLIFHPSISLEDKDGRPSNRKHVENIYEYPEAACLLSHLKAILRAYEDGHDQVFIMEDDALLSHNFLSQWYPYVQRAPLDWRILQFATNNKNVVKQGVNLLDFFVTWQPYHWSTRAYLLNREGMEVIINNTHSYSKSGKDIWRIDHDPMVVADEVIYYVAGEAYTSTGLWVDASSFGSTIQSTNAHANLSALVGTASKNNIMTNKMQRTADSLVYADTLLILMSMRLGTLEEIERELKWIRQDNHAIYTVHRECDWYVNVALTDNSLLEPFNKAIVSIPSNVHFIVQVTSEPFNKFSYLRGYVGEMLNYDLVLFKDNDQRIAGFPWNTFIHRKGDAVLAGPLRQNVDEALLYRHSMPKRQWFQFHAAESWTEDWSTQWSSGLFANVVPIDVPMLEMYFVLMDGEFANWFFDQILTPDFVNQTSAWGPDLLWCSAAREWDPTRPSCHLVPVISSHEDTQQIYKNTTAHQDGGNKMVEKFKENPKFSQWMKTSLAWKNIIGGSVLWQVEKNCRQILRPKRFDLQACAKKVSNPDKVKQQKVPPRGLGYILRRIRDVLVGPPSTT